ncbi:MAG: IS110 family transposase [Polaribacter sp.]
MKIKETIGIDISKDFFDVCIHSNQLNEKIENNEKGFKKLIEWVFKNTEYNKENTLFIFEFTGIYSFNLSQFLTEKNISFSMVSGLEIKRSLGIARGKDDQKDARKIALYGFRLRDEIKPYKMPSASIIKLKTLFSMRTKLVKDRAGYKSRLKEQKSVYNEKENQVLFKIQENMIEYFSNEIKNNEKAIDEIIKNDAQLKETYDLITSIQSVGKQTARAMIIFTHNFSSFLNSRKFASYSGIAPFPHQSGTSIRGKNKVNHLANKQMKFLLDMCAMNAIRNNTEMKKYYEKKVAEGKNKLSVINAVRNKLLARIFAVVNRKTPYVDTLKFAA